MAATLLVLTQDVLLGQLISYNLERGIQFNGRVFDSLEDAAIFVQQENCSLTFLDRDYSHSLDASRALLQVNPEMQFIYRSSENADPALNKLHTRPLTKPFYIRDLLELVEKLKPPVQSATQEQEADPDLPWLADNNRAAQYLTRLTRESSAQAALITRGEILWAFASQLSETAAHELAFVVNRSWDKTRERDLVRFVRLASIHSDHILFSTQLAAGVILSLAFDSETLLNSVYTQAGTMIHTLSAQKTSDEKCADAAVFPPFTTQDNYETGSASGPVVDNPEPAPPSSPDFVTQPFKRSRTGRLKPIPRTEDGRPDLQFESQSTPAPVEGRRIVLEPISASVYNLKYACLLLPRFPQHCLIGDLAERLTEWIREVNIAYGWRLEYNAIRPDYLHWISSVSPSTSPDSMMNIIQKITSERIFIEFPRFKLENLSGEFWTQAYLIIAGGQPLPGYLINEFIESTRQGQGIPGY